MANRWTGGDTTPLYCPKCLKTTPYKKDTDDPNVVKCTVCKYKMYLVK